MNSEKQMREMLKFYNEKKENQSDDNRITAMNYLESFFVDIEKKVDFGEIYILTREKNFEDSEDSYMCYEIYSKDDPSNLIASTDQDFQIKIIDDKLNKKLLKHNIDLDVNPKVLREMVRTDKKGNEVPACIVMDKFDVDEKDSEGLEAYSKKIKKEAIYNDKKQELVQAESVLTEKEIQDKSENKGKKIKEMKLIEDPFFYQLVPDATSYTYFVEYQDGTLGVMNSSGVDIASNDERGIANGFLEFKKMDKADIESSDESVSSTGTVLSIRGASKTHGVVFPIVKSNNSLTMEVKDIYDEDQPTFPLDMTKSNTDDLNIEKATSVDDRIIEVLQRNGIDDPDNETVKQMVEIFCEKDIVDPDEISILKEYKKVEREEHEEEKIDELERGERAYKKENSEE